jgi:hypothetical protein
MIAASTPPAITNATARASGGSRHFGGGEAQVLRDSETEAGRHSAEAIEREIATPDTGSEQNAAREGSRRPQQKSGAAA